MKLGHLIRKWRCIGETKIPKEELIRILDAADLGVYLQGSLQECEDQTRSVIAEREAQTRSVIAEREAIKKDRTSLRNAYSVDQKKIQDAGFTGLDDVLRSIRTLKVKINELDSACSDSPDWTPPYPEVEDE